MSEIKQKRVCGAWFYSHDENLWFNTKQAAEDHQLECELNKELNEWWHQQDDDDAWIEDMAGEEQCR